MFFTCRKNSKWNNGIFKIEESFIKGNDFILNINLDHNWNYYAILKGIRYLISLKNFEHKIYLGEKKNAM